MRLVGAPGPTGTRLTQWMLHRCAVPDGTDTSAHRGNTLYFVSLDEAMLLLALQRLRDHLVTETARMLRVRLLEVGVFQRAREVLVVSLCQRSCVRLVHSRALFRTPRRAIRLIAGPLAHDSSAR